MLIHFVTKHTCVRRMDEQTDAQNYDPQSRASYVSRGKINFYRINSATTFLCVNEVCVFINEDDVTACV